MVAGSLLQQLRDVPFFFGQVVIVTSTVADPAKDLVGSVGQFNHIIFQEPGIGNHQR